MSPEQTYVPSEADLRVAWAEFRGGALYCNPDYEFHLAIAQVRHDAAAEAWTDCVSEASAVGWLHEPAALDMLGRNPHEETP